MDNLEKQLKQDAEAIAADVSPELEARIAASIHAVGRPKPGGTHSAHQPGIRWWLFSTLTGAAAVLLVIAFVNRPPGELPGAVDPAPVAASRETPGSSGRSAPDTMTLVPLDLDVRTADFTDPLSRELDAVKSDLDKAREALEDDLRITF